MTPSSTLSLESKGLAGAPTLHLSLCSLKLSLLFCVPQKKTNKQKSNLSLLQAKPESLSVHRIVLIGKGSNRGRCHLICFRKSSITSTSLVKIICNTHNKSTGYVSVTSWVGIGRAYQGNSGIKEPPLQKEN